MRRWEKAIWMRSAVVLGLAVLPATASIARSERENPRDCSSISAPLGPRPVDRATVMQTMRNVQDCYSLEVTTPKSRSRYGLTLLLLVMACVGALTIAGLLFWHAKYMVGISVPLAVSVALLTVAAANLIDDAPGERKRADADRLEQARWRWTVRMTRSNQMIRDQDAIEEAISATNEFVSVALNGQ